MKSASDGSSSAAWLTLTSGVVGRLAAMRWPAPRLPGRPRRGRSRRAGRALGDLQEGVGRDQLAVAGSRRISAVGGAGVALEVDDRLVVQHQAVVVGASRRRHPGPDVFLFGPVHRRRVEDLHPVPAHAAGGLHPARPWQHLRDAGDLLADLHPPMLAVITLERVPIETTSAKNASRMRRPPPRSRHSRCCAGARPGCVRGARRPRGRRPVRRQRLRAFGDRREQASAESRPMSPSRRW